MAVKITRVKLWQAEIPNKPGALSSALEPFAKARTDLKVVMKYSIPGRSSRATVEIYPGKGKSAERAAKTAGFSLSPTPVLLVKGTNRKGLSYNFANTFACAGISVRFLSVQVIGTEYTALMGFKTEGEAREATSLIRLVTDGKKAV